MKQDRVVNYISANLGDMIWQDEISNQVQRIDKNHISLAVVFRLFRREDIEKSGLKSYARYIQKKDILNIDQILALDEYIELSEDEMRHQLCDAVFNRLEEVLIKYKERFQNLDSIALIPLLRERILRIKNQEFTDNYYKSKSFADAKRVEEIKKLIDDFTYSSTRSTPETLRYDEDFKKDVAAVESLLKMNAEKDAIIKAINVARNTLKLRNQVLLASKKS